MNEFTICIWIDDGENDFEKVGDYIVGAIPRIGDLLVIERAINLRVTDTIWSLNKKPIRIKDMRDGDFYQDLDTVDIYTKRES